MSEPRTGLRRLLAHSAPRFAVIGVLSLGVDVGGLYVFHGLLGVWLPLATALSFGLSFVVNFGLNRVWAFGSTSAVGGELGRYVLLLTANLGLNVVSVTGLVALGVPYLLAKLVTTGGLSAANYVASAIWVFRGVPAKGGAGDSCPPTLCPADGGSRR